MSLSAYLPTSRALANHLRLPVAAKRISDEALTMIVACSTPVKIVRHVTPLALAKQVMGSRSPIADPFVTGDDCASSFVETSQLL